MHPWVAKLGGRSWTVQNGTLFFHDNVEGCCPRCVISRFTNIGLLGCHVRSFPARICLRLAIPFIWAPIGLLPRLCGVLSQIKRTPGLKRCASSWTRAVVRWEKSGNSLAHFCFLGRAGTGDDYGYQPIWLVEYTPKLSLARHNLRLGITQPTVRIRLPIIMDFRPSISARKKLLGKEVSSMLPEIPLSVNMTLRRRTHFGLLSSEIIG